MKLFKNIAFVCSLLLFSGCSNGISYITPMINSDKKIVINQNEKIYIALSKNGIYKNQIYINSATAVSNNIYNILTSYTDKIEIAKVNETLEETITYAKQNNIKYIIYPTIMHWEDRATQWSGRLDRVSINILIYDVIQDKKLVYSNVNATTNINHIPRNDKPEELLLEAFSKFFLPNIG
jgi:hypothetical protein